MALSLTAEQKSIYKLFSGKEQYIIPPYQRAYSWSEEQCLELLDDLKRVYFDKNQEGYFLGNIVIAQSLEDRDRLEVIDGQQRLTTLTLLMKVLLYFDSENKDLENAITIPSSRRGGETKRRLKTNVFIEKDAKFLEDALNLQLDSEVCKISKDDNLFKKNICYFYHEIKVFSQNNEIQDFIDFFLYDVSLLPIQTEDNDANRAREKALQIFETINNRGLSLTDSDIFKAKLYAKALNELKHTEFIDKWKELDEESITINYSINEIFRIYTHVIRGKEGIKSTEVALREFFTQKDYSPFNKLDYKEVLNDLFKIIDSIKYFQDVITKPKRYSEITKWFQLINQYTNVYPKMALFVYLYHYDTKEEQKLIEFTKHLVRYAYYQGSTSKVKFYLFDVIIKITYNKEFSYYPDKVSEGDFDSFGMLKKGYALLACYLDDNQKALYPYHFDKIINQKDVKELDDSWQTKEFYNFVDTLGNMMILDFPKKLITLKKKIPYFKKSKVNEISALSNEFEEWTYSKYEQREAILRSRIKEFFRNPNAD